MKQATNKIAVYGLFLLFSGALLLSLVMLQIPLMAAGGTYYLRGEQCNWDSGCQLYDDGTNGDQFSGDYIHSLNLTINSPLENNDEYKFYRSDTTQWFPASGANLTFDSIGSCNTYMLAQGNPYGITINDGADPYASVSCDAAQLDFSGVTFIGNQDFNGSTNKHVNVGENFTIDVEVYANGLTNASSAASDVTISPILVQIEYEKWSVTGSNWSDLSTYGTNFSWYSDEGNNWSYRLTNPSFSEGVYRLRAQYTDFMGNTGNTETNYLYLYVSNATTTNHSINISSNFNIWRSNEKVGDDNGNANFYATWDDRYLYIYFDGGYDDNTAQLNVAVDVNPGIDSGITTADFAGVSFAGYLTPEYIIRSLNNTNLDLFTRSDTGWGTATNMYAATELYRTISGTTNKTHWRIPRSSVGLNKTGEFGLYFWIANSSGEWQTSLGIDPPTTSDNRYRTQAGFASMGSGVAVRTERIWDYNSSQTRNFDITSNYSSDMGGEVIPIRHIYVSAGIGTFIDQTTATGNVLIKSGATLVSESGQARTLTVGGNWTNHGTFTHNNDGTVIFNGSTAQTIGGNATTDFYNLTLNNSTGASLGRAQTVANQLTLTSGRLTLGSYKLTLGDSAPAIAGTFNDATMIVADGAGTLCKNYSADGSYFFPVGDATGTAEYSPATVNFASGTFASGQACVNLRDARHPNNNSPTHYLSRFWSVTASGITGFSASATFDYLDADINGTESSIQAYRRHAASWSSTGGSIDTSTNQISFSGLTAFSDFTGGNQPTAVTLVSFAATPQPEGIRVTWETAAELDNLGFHLHRSESATGPWAQLTSALIPPQFPGQAHGGEYEYLDTTALPGVTYYYRLEDVDIFGVRTFHGPVSAVMGEVRWQVYMPLVSCAPASAPATLAKAR